LNTYYFDHSASTPMFPKVVDTVADLMKLHYANASALHKAGTDAMKLVERARGAVAERFGAQPQEVVFTSGGTESNNLAITGTLLQSGSAARHIITTAVEHASVYQCVRQSERFGAHFSILPVDDKGRVNPEEVARAIRKDTVLVSVMHVNNETGIIQPIEQIGAILRAHPRIRFHVDGVQAIGKVPVAWRDWGIHLYSGSAHKFGGPKGTGFLLVKDGLTLSPLLVGGGQEHGVRPGTSNVPGFVGTAQALRLAMESMEDRRSRMYGLRKMLLAGIADIPELVVNGFGAEAGTNQTAPHVVNLSYPGMRPEVLVHTLEKQGILVSTQSACSSKSLQPSRVLKAMGYDDARASGSIRISFGDEHTKDDIPVLVDRLKLAVNSLKPLERGMK